MKTLDWIRFGHTFPHKNILLKSACAAFLLEALLLTGIGWHEHWLAHPQRSQTETENQFIEAQMYEVPPEAHLVEEKKVTSAPQKPEAVLSKRVGQGKPHKESTALEDENQTQAGPKVAATHGPVALYSPPPVIPSYLQDKELKTSVIIDFYVNAQGIATPRLVGSSGNEELDAIALKKVKEWQFRSAEKEGKPIESKVRLRIVFEVS